MSIEPQHTGDPLPAYSWLIRGLGGVVNLLEAVHASGIAINPHWLGELGVINVKLKRIITAQGERN